jgi:proteasome lid subunit RPN8/RPN11
MSAESTDFFWRESPNIYQPLERPLMEFLSTIELISPPPAPQLDDENPILVFIKESCFKTMQEHAHCDLRREQAGILCGQAYRDSGQLYVDVNAAFPVDTINSSTHFHFHERSWETVWKQFGDNSAIVGWYHTHPGLGIFLSPTDLRTQENYFAAAWQIAIVIDPINRKFGVFNGKGNLLEGKICITYSQCRN